MNTWPTEPKLRASFARRAHKAAHLVGVGIPKAKGSTIIGLLVAIAVLAILTAASAILLVSCVRLN